MLFAVYIGTFLGSVLILAAFSYVLPWLLKEESLVENHHPTSRFSKAVAVEPEVTTAASASRLVGLAISDEVDGATLLKGPSGVFLAMKGA